jgi:hypothetical protein
MRYWMADTSMNLKIGPFVSSSDGYTPMTGLTISQSDIRLSKNGGDFAQSSDTGGASHDENGWYDLTLSTSDTNSEGNLVVAIDKAGALPVWVDIMIVPITVFNSLVGGSDYLQTDVRQIEGTDATNQLGTSVGSALNTYDPPTKAEMDAGFAALNDLTAAEVNAEVDTALADYDPPTKAELDSGLAGLNDPDAATIADAVWEEDIVAAHNTGDTAGALLDDLGTPADFKADVSALALEANVETHAGNALTTYDPPTKAEMDAVHATTDGLIAAVDTMVDSILADTGTDGVVLADNAITAAKMATDAIGADELAADAAIEIADAILKRDWTSVSGEAARSVLNALRFLRNKWSISGTTLTVTEEDDSTSAWTASLTTDGGADPVTASDPT